MDTQPYLSDLSLEGDIDFSCPHGKARFQASRTDNRIDLSFENGSTFRHFLSSIQLYSDLSTQRGLLQQLAEIPQSVYVTLAGREILSSNNDKISVNYLIAGRQWLKWKLSRLF